jgi:hypothetical protein
MASKASGASWDLILTIGVPLLAAIGYVLSGVVVGIRNGLRDVRAYRREQRDR